MVKLELSVSDSIRNTNENQWNNLVHQSTQGTIFHTYDWLLLLEETLPWQPKHLILLQDGNPLGILPNFITSISDTPLRQLESIPLGSGGPVIGSEETAVFSKMVDGISKICSGSIISHKLIIHDLNHLRYGQPLDKHGYSPVLTHCRFHIDLEKAWGTIESQMSSDRRYNLNKALEQDYTINEKFLNGETLSEFHSAYQATMNRVGGFTYPKAFFRRLGDNLQNDHRLLSVAVDGQTVGYHLYILDDERILHLFSGVEENDFQYYPSELLHQHTIKWGIDQKYSVYDFGSTPASFNDGMFKYKSQYGGDSVPNLVWRKPQSKIGWGLYQYGLQISDIWKSFR